MAVRSVSFTVIPLTWRQACSYVDANHRHHQAPRGCKWAIGIVDGTGTMRGVALCGRPVSRMLDDGFTIEVNRTCTDGYPNANSCLYGASWRIARAMGYLRLVTYNQAGESGASLRAGSSAHRPGKQRGGAVTGRVWCSASYQGAVAYPGTTEVVVGPDCPKHNAPMHRAPAIPYPNKSPGRAG